MTLAQDAVDRENPWPGLSAFTEEMGSFFYGREAEKEDLFRLVKRSHLVTLFGQSGLGKTSLIYAGLFPLLRQANCLPVNIRLIFAEASPPLVQQVRARLLEVVRDQDVECPEFPARQTPWEYLHRSDVDFWSADNHLLTPVFVFDQFEEIFTIGSSGGRADELHELLQELSDLVENRYPATLRQRIEEDPTAILPFETDKQNFRILFSLREDYLPHLEDLKPYFSGITENRLRLNRMNGLRALESTVGAGGPLITEEVAAKVVHFVAADRRWQEGSDERSSLAALQVEPSLLSVVCHQLNKRRKAQGLSIITSDLLTGTRDQILEDLYRETIDDLPKSATLLVENKLITESGYRDSLALENALRIGGMNRTIINKLVDRRLLRLEERFGILRIELMHDVLTGVAQRNRVRRKITELGLFGINCLFVFIVLLFLGIFFFNLPDELRHRQWLETASYGQIYGDVDPMQMLVSDLKRSMRTSLNLSPGWVDSISGGILSKSGLPANTSNPPGAPEQPVKLARPELPATVRDELNDALWAAAIHDNIPEVRTLIRAGADLRNIAGERAMTNGHLATARFIFFPSVRPEMANTDDYQLGAREGLTWAVKNNDLELASWILENGFDLKASYHAGAPFLLVALELNEPDLVRLLIQNGADPNQTGESDTITPADWAAKNRSPLSDLLSSPQSAQPTAPEKSP